MHHTRRLLTAMGTSRQTKIAAYQRPTTLADRPSPVCPGISYIPLQTPPASRAPALPSRPEIVAPAGWTRSEHTLRAAYPRTFVESTGRLTRESAPFALDQAPADEDRDAKKKRIMREVKGAITQRLDATMTYEGDGQPALWVAAERWARPSFRDGGETGPTGARRGRGVSLVLTHANGFTKESWHPVIRRLLQQPEITQAAFGVPPLPSPSPQAAAPDEIEIDEVWFLDDIHHGASVDLNAGVLGPVHNWVDGGRDIVAAIEQTIRKESPRRKVVGIGHSFGANATVQAAHARPDLFEAILLVEPMCPPVRVTRESIDAASRASLVFGALKRRGDWPSTDEAAKIRRSPFFASWHPEAFDLWLSHGLVPLGQGGDGAVQLATPKWGEAAVFAETEGLGLGWDKLAQVQVPVGFVMAGDATATDGEETTREMVWRPAVCANERFMDAGHLIVQEQPDELADAIRRFLGNALLPAEYRDAPPRAHL